MRHLLGERFEAICVANRSQLVGQRRTRVGNAAAYRTEATATTAVVVADKLHQGQKLELSCKVGICSETFDSCGSHL